MNISKFQKEFALQNDEYLKSLGFEQIASGNYIRFNPTSEINLIGLQLHSDRKRISLNYGVHYDFLPFIGMPKQTLKKDIRIHDCEIIQRVAPSPSCNDHWWQVEEKSINGIIEIIKQTHSHYFNSYKVLELSKISLEDFKLGISLPFSEITEVRACLLLARMHNFQSNYELAKTFSEYGLSISGMAVGPKAQFREIIEAANKL